MILDRRLRRLALCMLSGAALAACSATNGTLAGSGSGSSENSGAGAGSSAGSASGGAGTAANGSGAGGSSGVGLFDGGFGGGGGGNGQSCSVASQYVYTLTADNKLYKFDPPSLTFTLIGDLDCPTQTATPFSMAVDRNAGAWSVFTDGSLYQIDTSNAHCTATAYAPGQSGFFTFGMGFSSNSPGSSDETLFVSSDDDPSLASIDTTTLTLTPIGAYDQLDARAELTGTGDARLFGAFEGTPYIVAQIEKSDAKILSQAPQTAIQYAPDSSNFAFAFWGGDFWLFVGPGSSTDVFHYKPSDGTTTKVSTVQFEIVGAGVSTCAPITPPT
jgi:hypothetical protein